MALDSRGVPHVIYIEASSRELRYATKTGSTWTKTSVDGWHTDPGCGNTVVIMPGDIPAFARGGGFHVWSASGWSSEPMAEFYSPWSSTVALDAAGNAFGITQWSYGSGLYQGYVHYGERHDGQWSDSYLTDALFLPTDPDGSIVMDPDGDPHISLTTSYGESLQYWHRENGVWSSAVLIPGTWSSVALDEQGSPRISFYDTANKDLVIARLSGGSWHLARIDEPSEVGLHTAQELRNSISYITYYDQSRGDLKFAVCTSAGFSVTAVDTAGDVGAWTSLALDPEGRPHVVYYDATNGDLKYAVGSPGVPTKNANLGRLKHIYRK